MCCGNEGLLANLHQDTVQLRRHLRITLGLLLASHTPLRRQSTRQNDFDVDGHDRAGELCPPLPQFGCPRTVPGLEHSKQAYIAGIIGQTNKLAHPLPADARELALLAGAWTKRYRLERSDAACNGADGLRNIA